MMSVCWSSLLHSSFVVIIIVVIIIVIVIVSYVDTPNTLYVDQALFHSTLLLLLLMLLHEKIICVCRSSLLCSTFCRYCYCYLLLLLLLTYCYFIFCSISHFLLYPIFYLSPFSFPLLFYLFYSILVLCLYTLWMRKIFFFELFAFNC
jgi:hypothetical protein